MQMFNYYTSIVLMTWMVLAVLSILISENDRIPKNEKRSFYLTYILIAIAALAELVGVLLNGREEYPKELLLAVKCLDYTLTPMAGVSLVAWIYRDNLKERIILWFFFSGNIFFQVLSAFFGWMVVIDDQNRYSHGPLYFIYVIFYLAVVEFVIYKFLSYGSNFRRKNRASLYSIMILLLIGIFLQETSVTNVRTVYLTMAMGACLLFIHYTEFAQLKSDDSITVQQFQLMTDPLTGVQSRYAYSEMLKNYERSPKLSRDLVVFSVDVNGLKPVNDKLGHEAGDELICGAADCIRRAMEGECFRTGGDEFIILTRIGKQQAQNILDKLRMETQKWSGRLVKELHLAAGYATALDHPGCTAEELIRKSDLKMYADKANYYRKSGHDRRGQIG